MEPEYIDKAKAYISEHLKTEFSLNDLAENVGYSAFHLAREFKTATNLSIMEYTRNKRIAAASGEIENGRNICDVAMEYCFETHAGFTKAFSALFGCSPKQFQDHSYKMKAVERDVFIVEDAKIVIRHVCKDDVQDL